MTYKQMFHVKHLLVLIFSSPIVSRETFPFYVKFFLFSAAALLQQFFFVVYYINQK